MILTIILAANCAAPIMINKTDKEWNEQDYNHLAIAKKRCGQIYKNSACVKKFIKRTETDYSVVCGK